MHKLHRSGIIFALLALAACGRTGYEEGRALQHARNSGYTGARVARVADAPFVCAYPTNVAGVTVSAFAFGTNSEGGLICLVPGEEPRIMTNHG